MPSLFVANTTNKHHVFSFRLPGVEQLRHVTIPAGKQAPVIQNAQQEEIEAILNQHKLYGMVHESEAKKHHEFTGLIYSIDKTVTTKSMEVVREKNNDILLEKGHELRKIAAVATDAAVTEAIENTRDKIGKQKSVELEIIEDQTEATVNQKQFNEKIRVDRKAKLAKA